MESVPQKESFVKNKKSRREGGIFNGDRLLANGNTCGGQLAEGSLVGNHHHIAVQLQDRGGALGGDGAAESGIEGIGLVGTAGDQQ